MRRDVGLGRLTIAVIKSPAHQPRFCGQDTGGDVSWAVQAVADLREAAVSETHDTKDVLAALAARSPGAAFLIRSM